MTASVVSASFVVCGISALWLLLGQYRETATRCLQVGVVTAAIACVLQLFPTGDRQGRLVADHQPVALAAMEGLFDSGPGAKLAIIGQPDARRGRLENPIQVPGLLSFLAYGSFGSTVLGLNDVPHDQWPDNMELSYYAYHVMVGLGTLFIILALLSRSPALSRQVLSVALGTVDLDVGDSLPLHRQHRRVDGCGDGPATMDCLRTDAHFSRSELNVGAGNAIFTFIGFCGLYLVVGLLFLYLVGREIVNGPPGGLLRPDSTANPMPSAGRRA